MAEPDRPPGHRSLFDFSVRRVAEKRACGWDGRVLGGVGGWTMIEV